MPGDGLPGANRTTLGRLTNGWTLLLVCLAVYGPLFWQIPLARGESIYALIPKEMLAAGSWFTPILNGVPYLDKPPLLYWINLLGYKILGVSDWAARVPTLLLSLGQVWITYLIGVRLLNRRAAWLGGFILLSCVGFCALSLQLLADHLITLCLAASLYFMLRWQEAPGFRWSVLFFLTLVVGFLGKSFIGVGFPLAIGGIYALYMHQPRLFTLFFSPKGLVLVMLLIVPWFVGVENAHPGFLKHQFVNEQILRFLGQRQPLDISPFSLAGFWVFLAIWLMPWTVLLPEALVRFWRETGGSEEKKRARLLIIWVAVILGFFTLSASRIEYYSLPALPALALVVGWRLDRYLSGPRDTKPVWGLLLIALLGMTLLLLLPNLEALCAGNRREFVGLVALIEPLAWLASFLVPTLALVGLVAGFRRPWVTVGSYSVLALALVGLTFYSLVAISPHLSDKTPGEYIRDHAGAQDLMIMEAIEEYEMCGSMVFYADHPILMVQRDGLPEFPYPVPPEKNYLISPERLKELWFGPQRVFLLVDDAFPVEHYLEGALAVVKIPGKRLIVNHP